MKLPVRRRLKASNWLGKPWRVSSIVATADHNTPTDHWEEGIKTLCHVSRLKRLDSNIREVGACLFPHSKIPSKALCMWFGPEMVQLCRNDRGLW